LKHLRLVRAADIGDIVLQPDAQRFIVRVQSLANPRSTAALGEPCATSPGGHTTDRPVAFGQAWITCLGEA